MTKDEWERAINILDTLEAFDECAKCRLCAYEENCNEHTGCADGMAKALVNIEKDMEAAHV